MKEKIQIFLSILMWTVISATTWNPLSPYVKTPLGGIEGYYKRSADGRQFAAFEGIPYAKPPIGNLRFEPPVPVSPWVKDIKAVSFSPICSQILKAKDVVMDEDCLYLNIYVPATQNKTLLPVIFWIYGGGFTVGAGQNYGPKYLMDRDLILVTFNHRVGSLGFLTTEDNVVPGNMGLKDQVVALKWISNNIIYFGGDPKKITLMGTSAGGASVQYHYLSPQSRGLFRNGLSFSGSAFNPWAFNYRNALNVTKSFANSLNCPIDNSSRMIQCLKQTSVDNIINATNEIRTQSFSSLIPFVPVAEKTSTNYFINDTPENIMLKGDVYDVPWITGAVREEGLFMTASFILNDTLVKNYDKNWESLAPQLLFMSDVFPANEQPIVARMAKEYYFCGKPITSDMASTRKLTHLVGDAIITSGSIRAAKLKAKISKSPVRFYFYTYRAAQSTSDAMSNSTVNLGVAHDDDVYLVFENKQIDPTTTKEDRAMLQYMLNYWYSVANGNPDLGKPWPPVDPSSDFRYMHIAGPNNSTVETNKNLANVLFWEQIQKLA